MTPQDFLASLRKLLERFRKTPWFRVTILVLLGLIVAQLYLLAASSVGCLVVLLMPLLVFVVPYWLGERKVRRLAVNGLPVFLIAILVAAAMSTQALLAQGQALPLRSFPGASSSPIALSNGTVAPYHASPAQEFTFRVQLKTTANGNASSQRVYLNLTVITGLPYRFELPTYTMGYSPGPNSSANTKNGSWYERRLNLTDSIYGYGFSAWDGRGNWSFTVLDFGPLTAPAATFYGFFFYATGFSMIVPLLFYYVIIFMWWYTRRAREFRARSVGAGVEIPKDKPPPKQETGGKVSKAAAFTCTNCGADVTETDQKCPKCGAVFEE